MNILRNQIESESHLQYRGYKPDKLYRTSKSCHTCLPVSMLSLWLLILSFTSVFLIRCFLHTYRNRPYFVRREWSLMRRNIIKKRLILFAFQRTPHISLSCKLVPIHGQYRDEYEDGLFVICWYNWSSFWQMNCASCPPPHSFQCC